MKRDVNVVFEGAIPENTIAVDAVIQTVAAEIFKPCGDICIDNTL